MKIEKGRCPTTIITGEKINANEWSRLRDEVKEMAQECTVKLVVDMGKTRFIDSMGLGKLVSLLRTATNNQGDIKIAAPMPEVLTMLKLTRLDEVFDIYDNLESAEQSFASPVPSLKTPPFLRQQTQINDKGPQAAAQGVPVGALAS
ncbi:MAG: STAS domain-containing protein [Desulfomonilaceae bacterium]